MMKTVKIKNVIKMVIVESDGDGYVQADGHVLSFLTLHQLMENEQWRYVSNNLGS